MIEICFLGAAEYIPCDDESKLDDYDYVHRCYKFDKDVDLRLIPLAQLKRPLLRTGKIDFEALTLLVYRSCHIQYIGYFCVPKVTHL